MTLQCAMQKALPAVRIGRDDTLLNSNVCGWVKAPFASEFIVQMVILQNQGMSWAL